MVHAEGYHDSIGGIPGLMIIVRTLGADQYIRVIL